MKKIIVWLRQDLRLTDNSALYHAAQRGAVIPLYILDDKTPKEWALGSASRWWLHHSLKSLSDSFDKYGVQLILRKGKPENIIPLLVKEIQANGVYWNRCYEPYAIIAENNLKKKLHNLNLDIQNFNASLLLEPWDIKNKQGSWFKVFTPFWKHCLQLLPPDSPLDIPTFLKSKIRIDSEPLDNWKLLPTQLDWPGGLQKIWKPGESGAKKRLSDFLNGPLHSYSNGRDIPGIESTSKLSPHIHFGEISPRQIWYATHFHYDMNEDPTAQKHLHKFLAELGWREFSYHLLYHFPEFPNTSFRPEFQNFSWKTDKKMLTAWQQGKTGFPMVDAGMRQLWHTGSMHNRVRMITASFLTKHLLIAWQEGAKWFWDTLVDADLANNSASWQWVAGCGVDAAPYFRIFNPVLQGEKFDPDGNYVKKWLPELDSVPKKYIHCPWKMDTTPNNYPTPIVDHSLARQRALDAYEQIKKKK